MSNKITLTIEPSLIQQAKEYAHRHKKSLSELVAAYFKTVVEEEPVVEEEELSPIVKSLKGSIRLPADFDWKKDKMERLTKKYL